MFALLPLILLLAAPPDFAVRKQVLGSALVLHASPRTAGAIDSLKFRGKEFVNAYDHGRGWQSAVGYDGLGDCLYAMAAGSAKDGTGPDSSSDVVNIHTTEDALLTVVKMAYWLQPAEPRGSGCGTAPKIREAQNKTVVSGDTLMSQTTVGYGNFPNVIEYLATLNVSEPHKAVVFEALTGYMPPEFALLLTLDPTTSQLAPLAAGKEQSLPVIVATKDRMFAAGVYSPTATYNLATVQDRPRTPGWNATKWSAISRRADTPAGPYTYRCFVALGTVEEVKKALLQLLQESR